MSRAELFNNMCEDSNQASLLAERLRAWAIRNGDRLTQDDLQTLVEARNRMQRAVCAATKIELLARGGVDPNETSQ
jgi:hypothetical protein